MPSSSRTRARAIVGGAGQRSAVDAPRWSPDELEAGPIPEPQAPPLPPAISQQLPSAEDRAYERGFGEGLAAGKAQEAKRLSETVAAMESAIQALVEARPSWLDNLSQNMVALSIAVAEQVVQRELAADHETVQQLVRSAVAQFPVEAPLTVRLHPADLANLDEVTAPGSDVTAGREVRWRGDPLIDRGGCVVEGPERLVDGRVDKALLRIYRELATND